MSRSSLLLLFFVSGVVSQETELKGCNLVIPKEVEIRQEPQPEEGPLIVNASFIIFRLGDVPKSGGSFGVDFKQALLTFYINEAYCTIILL